MLRNAVQETPSCVPQMPSRTLPLSAVPLVVIVMLRRAALAPPRYVPLMPCTPPLASAVTWLLVHPVTLWSSVMALLSHVQPMHSRTQAPCAGPRRISAISLRCALETLHSALAIPSSPLRTCAEPTYLCAISLKTAMANLQPVLPTVCVLHPPLSLPLLAFY
jgi:hypothetical protein